MTETQIEALEWACRSLLGAEAPEFETLCNLLEETKQQYFERLNNPRILDFMKKWGITIPLREFSKWRWLRIDDQLLGEVNGLPESRGRVVATNGILCYIERVDRFPFLGHYESFVPDLDQPSTAILGGIKPRIHKNIWGHWSGYFAGAKVKDFADEASAQAWLASTKPLKPPTEPKAPKATATPKKDKLSELLAELDFTV